VVSFTHLPLYSRGKSPRTYCIRGWVSPKIGLDAVEDSRGIPTFNLWYQKVVHFRNSQTHKHRFLKRLVRDLIHAKSYIFWDMTPCRPLKINRRFGGTYRLMFSNTLSLCSSLNVRNQVSHPYSTTGKIIVLYIRVFLFMYIKRKDKRFCTEW
jgi:hypothetical protein